MEYWALGTAGAALIGLIMAVVYARLVTREPEGDEKMKAIAAAIREGAMAFIRREYRVLAIFVAIVFVLQRTIVRRDTFRNVIPIYYIGCSVVIRNDMDHFVIIIFIAIII